MRRGLVRLARSASATAGVGASSIRKRLQESIIPRMDGGLNSAGFHVGEDGKVLRGVVCAVSRLDALYRRVE